ncbi:ABC transporter substrate-binding protein [Chlorobium sp. N1]|uniref:ABC transporter substrate-binding protein n=1 Tax=Chlorobium sp. N1 TaxID=2491138 RepID=UPI00103A6737|nr:ABC transporter substrate-binding protein [Chlorobium sp. N1]TCD47213.1 ABC transporter substrate-binding protein [Chlorobium sp. N1]
MMEGVIRLHVLRWRLFVPLLFLLLASCYQKAEPPADASRTVTDMAGRTLPVPDRIERVYVNRPGSVLMYAMAPDLLVNRPFRHSPAEQEFLLDSYNGLPYVDGSAEEIIRLHPDVIVSVFSINAASIEAADKLSAKTGVPVFMLPMAVEDYPRVFRLLGELLDRREQAERMTGFVRQWLNPLMARAKAIPDSLRKRVYYAEGDRGLHTDPSGSFHSRAIADAGGVNVADVKVMPGVGLSPVSMEQVLRWDPDVVLVWTGMGGKMTTMEHIGSDPLWSRARAVRDGHLYQIPFLPFGWFDRPPGVNRILGTIWAAEMLYPDRFAIDLDKATGEFFRIFYHRNLDDGELKRLLHPESAPPGR